MSDSLSISDSSRSRRPWLPGMVSIFLVLVVLLIGAYVWHTRRSAEAVSVKITKVVHSPDHVKEADLTFGLVEIVIDPSWTLLSGHHPTVTFRGTARSSKEKIQYTQFVYHTLKQPRNWVVDATGHHGDDYTVRIRDLDHGDEGVCWFVVSTRDNKYVSTPVPFKIP